LDFPDHAKLLPITLSDLEHLPGFQRLALRCGTKTKENIPTPGRPGHFERQKIGHVTEKLAVAIFVR
jgi:hypothetical protein